MIFIGLIFGILCMLPFVLKRRHQDKQQKQEYLKELKDLKEQIDNEQSLFNTLNAKSLQLCDEVKRLELTRENLQDTLSHEQELIKQSTQNFQDTLYEHMADGINAEAERLSQWIEDQHREYDEEYRRVLTDYTANFSNHIKELEEQKSSLERAIASERSKANAARLANQRDEEKKESNNKYKLLIKETDLNEIKRLKEVIPFMRNPRPINKIIWEGYFRQLTNELINRIIGSGAHIGVYCITNLLNGKRYIGQSVDLAERFKQHVKCGLGIDAPSNLLYKAMQADGVENFSFEVLEECERSKLNEEEIYWINYYKSQEYGYNMTKGGS